MGFGETLREIRRKRGSLRQVAKTLCTDFAYLSRLENDRVGFTPSREFIENIVEKLKCDEDERESLFSEARRMDSETEHAMDELHHRPSLKTLFVSAPKLSDRELEKVNQRIQNILKKKGAN
jgi:transcriptional regulator with XRE-family HTH domain